MELRRAGDKNVQNTWYEMYLVQTRFKELKGLSDNVTKNTRYGIVCLQAWLLTRWRLDHLSPGVRDQLRQQSKKVLFGGQDNVELGLPFYLVWQFLFISGQFWLLRLCRFGLKYATLPLILFSLVFFYFCLFLDQDQDFFFKIIPFLSLLMTYFKKSIVVINFILFGFNYPLSTFKQNFLSKYFIVAYPRSSLFGPHM